MPSVGRLLAAQIGYQARLLASGRAVTLGVIFPVILLIASHARARQITAADVAQYAVFGLSLTAWNTYGVRLVAAREAGVLKRWRATPLPRWCYFLGRVLATVVVATLAAAATVAVGVLLYHTHLSVDAALGALVVFVLGSFAWAATATAVTAAIPTVEAAAPTMMLIYFPVVIISGALGLDQRTALAVHPRQLPARPTPRPRGRHRPRLHRRAQPGSPPATSRPRRLGHRRHRRLRRHLPLGTPPTHPAPTRPVIASGRFHQLSRHGQRERRRGRPDHAPNAVRVGHRKRCLITGPARGPSCGCLLDDGRWLVAHVTNRFSALTFAPCFNSETGTVRRFREITARRKI